MVAATNWLWWFTDSAVLPWAKWATAESGTIVSCPVLTAAPADALLLPLAARAFCAALRCELLMPLADATAAVAPVTVPDGALVVAVPEGVPPAVLIQIWLRMSGFCQYSGATSITT